MSKVTRSIVEYGDGTLGVLIEVDGKEYCRLYSTFVPKTKADIKFFGFYVIGSTAAISPEDNEPLGKDHDKTSF